MTRMKRSLLTISLAFIALTLGLVHWLHSQHLRALTAVAAGVSSLALLAASSKPNLRIHLTRAITALFLLILFIEVLNR